MRRPMTGKKLRRKIRAKFGTVTAFAEQLGISPHAVYQWPRCPRDRALIVATLLELPVSEVRPDLYPVGMTA